MIHHLVIITIINIDCRYCCCPAVPYRPVPYPVYLSMSAAAEEEQLELFRENPQDASFVVFISSSSSSSRVVPYSKQDISICWIFFFCFRLLLLPPPYVRPCMKLFYTFSYTRNRNTIPKERSKTVGERERERGFKFSPTAASLLIRFSL